MESLPFYLLWFSTYRIILLILFWYKSHAQPKVASANDSTPFCIGFRFSIWLDCFYLTVSVCVITLFSNFLKCFTTFCLFAVWVVCAWCILLYRSLGWYSWQFIDLEAPGSHPVCNVPIHLREHRSEDYQSYEPRQTAALGWVLTITIQLLRKSLGMIGFGISESLYRNILWVLCYKMKEGPASSFLQWKGSGMGLQLSLLVLVFCGSWHTQCSRSSLSSGEAEDRLLGCIEHCQGLVSGSIRNTLCLVSSLHRRGELNEVIF